MQLRSLVVATVAVTSLLPGTVSAAQEPEGPADAALDSPAEGPAEAPAVAAPAPAPPAAAPIEPDYKGSGLIGAAIGVTAFSWVSRITGLGLLASGCDSEEGCLARFSAGAAFTYLAPISQFIATGLVVPGALLKGRHDGWRQVTTGAPDRNGKTYIVAGGVVFGVFTALSIAMRPAILIGCIEIGAGGGGCGSGVGPVAGYYIGVQASDTLSTVGAGLLSYGVGYNGYRRRHGPRVSVAPFSSGFAYGLSLSGRF